MKKKILMLGLHPDVVDFAETPGLTHEKLTHSLARQEKSLNDLGFDARWCLVDRNPAAARPHLAGPAGCAQARPLGLRHDARIALGGQDWLLRIEADGRSVVWAPDCGYTVADLPGDIDDDGKLVLIRRLVREGLVRVSF